MASETLSQNEIDRLLDGPREPDGSEGTADAPRQHGRAPGRTGGDPDVRVYDFRRPHRVSKERLRALEALYGRMTKSFETWLLGRMRSSVSLTLQSVEQLSFAEFVLSLSSPCVAYTIDIRDSGEQQGVIAFGSELAFLIVDRLLGGKGTPTIPDRALTTIERLVVRTAAERLAAYTADAWSDHVPLDLSVAGFESVPEIIQACNPEDPVLVATVEVRADDFVSLAMMVLPFVVLEKFFTSTGRRSVNSGTGSERERAMNLALNASHVRSTRVTVAARLPDIKLTIRDLTEMRVGSIIATGIATDATSYLLIGGQPRFKIMHGKAGNRLAVRIVDRLDPPSSAPHQNGSATASPSK